MPLLLGLRYRRMSISLRAHLAVDTVLLTDRLTRRRAIRRHGPVVLVHQIFNRRSGVARCVDARVILDQFGRPVRRHRMRVSLLNVRPLLRPPDRHLVLFHPGLVLLQGLRPVALSV